MEQKTNRMFEVQFDNNGRMIGSIPWNLISNDSTALIINHGGKPGFEHMARSSASRFGKTYGFKISIKKHDDHHLVATLVTVLEKGRKSKYNKILELQPGESIDIPWDLSKGPPAPEYRSIYRVYVQAERHLKWKMTWKNGPQFVTIGRIS